MKFGAQLKVYRAQWDEMEVYIQAMEAGRWCSLWFPDHFLPPTPIGIPIEQDEQNQAYEAFIPLAVAAGMTERIKLGSLVLGNTYRNPALVAKMAAELDQASKGRFILGIGAGWFEREHQAYGWTFPSLKERQDRLEEACILIRKLFTAETPVDFQGRYYRLENAPLSPGCYQKPAIPIMIGGNGERRTLRTLARYGDIWNYNGWAGMDIEVFKHKLNVLAQHCETIDRDPAEIKLTVHYPLRLADNDAERKRLLEENPRRTVGSRNFHLDLIGEFKEAGVEEMCCASFSSVEDLQRVDEEIITAFD
ncbi:MAG: LLM class flavin-dependent oxidoreductase [Chloroflexota bacterium]